MDLKKIILCCLLDILKAISLVKLITNTIKKILRLKETILVKLPIKFKGRWENNRGYFLINENDT